MENRPILVIGGGIGGMTAAIEAAEVGHEVVLVEKEPYLGGRIIRTYRYFPKMCPPACGYEINIRRIRQNPRIKVHTLAEVREIRGSEGQYRVRILLHPRYVKQSHSITEEMLDGLTGQRPNEFNLGLDSTHALYRAHPNAYPPAYVLDKSALTDEDRQFLADHVPPGSIDLEMKEKEIEIDIASVIVATGWRPYDATRLDNLGYGKYANVVTNVMMERMASKSGPTGGKILRPSNGEVPKNVAFVQCAGSRDENHLPYCSAVCCMASMKQARYLLESSSETKATLFYIDLRTVGRLEKFYFDMLDLENVEFVKGKVALVSENPGNNNLILDVEDTLHGKTLHDEFDMVVLATGIVPNTDDLHLPDEITLDQYGFLDNGHAKNGIYAAGCVKRPSDVSRTTKDATAAALKAIQSSQRGE